MSQLKLRLFGVGDRVTVIKQVIEEARGDWPASLCAMPGDKLIVRAVDDPPIHFEYQVSHETRTDGMTFGVHEHEIAPIY